MDLTRFIRPADQPEAMPPELLTLRVLDDSECAAIIGKAREELGWYHSMVAHDDHVGYEVEPEGRNSQSLKPADFARHFPGLHDRIADVVFPAVRERFAQEFDSIQGLHLIQYPTGGYFVTHTDRGEQFPHRELTVICYIDQDYGGGETAFPSLEVLVKGRSGWALVFSSDLVHSGMPIQQGTKLIAVGFLERIPFQVPTSTL